MKNLHVEHSPLTNHIYCGSVLKDGQTWAANQTEVTVKCLMAVAAHGLQLGKPIELKAKDGSHVIRMTVERIDIPSTAKKQLKSLGD